MRKLTQGLVGLCMAASSFIANGDSITNPVQIVNAKDEKITLVELAWNHGPTFVYSELKNITEFTPEIDEVLQEKFQSFLRIYSSPETYLRELGYQQLELLVFTKPGIKINSFPRKELLPEEIRQQLQDTITAKELFQEEIGLQGEPIIYTEGIKKTPGVSKDETSPHMFYDMYNFYRIAHQPEISKEEFSRSFIGLTFAPYLLTKHGKLDAYNCDVTLEEMELDKDALTSISLPYENITTKREKIIIKNISEHEHPQKVRYIIYGSQHDFSQEVREHNKENPDNAIDLYRYTPDFEPIKHIKSNLQF